MKKLYLLTLVLITVLTVSLQSQAASKGEKVFGVHTGYVSRNNSADIGLFFQYSFSERFRLQPSADIIFRHKDRDAYTIDLNAQVPIDIGFQDRCTLYPFAGLNFSSWNHHLKRIDFEQLTQEDVSYRNNYFGINVGAGFDLRITSTMKISIEAGYTFVKQNSGVRILAGIGYIF